MDFVYNQYKKMLFQNAGNMVVKKIIKKINIGNDTRVPNSLLFMFNSGQHLIKKSRIDMIIYLLNAIFFGFICDLNTVYKKNKSNQIKVLYLIINYIIYLYIIKGIELKKIKNKKKLKKFIKDFIVYILITLLLLSVEKMDRLSILLYIIILSNLILFTNKDSDTILIKQTFSSILPYFYIRKSKRNDKILSSITHFYLSSIIYYFIEKKNINPTIAIKTLRNTSLPKILRLVGKEIIPQMF